VKSNPPAIQSTAPQRDEGPVAPSSKGRKVGVSVAAPPPAPEKLKNRPTLDRPSAIKTARAAQSKPVKKVRDRPKVSAAKKASKAKPVRKPSRKAAAGSKQDSVIALLRRPEGATLDNLVKATGWQPHSVRGFLAGTVRKKLKLPLQSQKVDGKRTYGIRAGKSAAKTGKSRTV
jgi:Protein of unknown function (DUF3489)